MCSAQKSLGVHAIKDRGRLEEHAAHQAWTGKKKDFKAWVLLRYTSELFLLKDNKGIVSSSSPSTGTLGYSLLLCSKTLPIHSVLKESLLGCVLLILFPDWFSQPSYLAGIFLHDVVYIPPSRAPSQMGSLLRGETTAAWASPQRRALEHGWHSCAEFIHRQTKKRAFLHAKVERRGYQWTEVNIQRTLGLPLSSVGLPGVSNFSFVCFLKAVSDWKKPRNTCTPAFTRPSFEPLFSQSTATGS